MLVLDDRVIDTDEQGYLKNSADWSTHLAPLLAEREGIILTESHWEVILFMRDFYQQYNTSPAIRLLVTALAQKFGYDKGSSRYLHRLFPKSSAQQASKIAGLPKPVKCL